MILICWQYFTHQNLLHTIVAICVYFVVVVVVCGFFFNWLCDGFSMRITENKMIIVIIVINTHNVCANIRLKPLNCAHFARHIELCSIRKKIDEISFSFRRRFLATLSNPLVSPPKNRQKSHINSVLCAKSVLCPFTLQYQITCSISTNSDRTNTNKPICTSS